ncbi:MAG: hypothetical protein WA491_04390 [Candidatus Acidiferrum sp.]
MRLFRACLDLVQRNGGVLEHPAASVAWKCFHLPRPNQPPDSQGGYTIYVEQSWFGCSTRKPTWLYIVGVPKRELPSLPFRLAKPWLHQGGSSAARSRTMPELARWLCQIARLTTAPPPK